MGCCCGNEGGYTDEGGWHPEKKNTFKHPRVSSKRTLTLNQSNYINKNTTAIDEEYELLKELGEGGFGKVLLARHKASGSERAVKIIRKDSLGMDSYQHLMDEIEILKNVRHPNILVLYEYFESDDHVYLVTELCKGGDMYDYIVNNKSLTEQQTANVMYQVLSATIYSHENKIVHRDLKPENLILKSEPGEEFLDIKVIDYGLAILYEGKALRQMVGSVYYMAPELIKRNYTEKWDIWSIGIIAYILLAGYPPFQGINQERILRSVLEDKLLFIGDEWDHTSPQAKEFIEFLLNKDPQTRPSAQEAIEHPWIVEFGKSRSDPEQRQVVRSLTALQKFSAGLKLKQALIGYMSYQMMKQEEIDALRKQFIALDINGDGHLSKEELIEGYRKVNAHDVDIDHIIDEIDAGGTGSIEFNEFIAATSDKQELLCKEHLEYVFNLIDKDHSGTISTSELNEIFGEDYINESVWRELIDEADQNTDGEIDINEFYDLLLK